MLEKIPDAFNDAANVTRSHIEAANAPAKVKPSTIPATTTMPRTKRGRPPGAKDSRPRQRQITIEQPATILHTVTPIPIVDNIHENEEMSLQYNKTGHIYQRSTTKVDDLFAFHVAQAITDNPDPLTLKEAQNQQDWPK